MRAKTQLKQRASKSSPALSVCCLSGGRPERLAALLSLLRPVADELVVAVDDRVDPDLLGPVRGLADILIVYPYADPVERAVAWIHSLCHGDWVFRIDDDEVPSLALLDALGSPDERLTHAWVPRRWLWDEGWLAADPWTPDWQLRLVRPSAARFPGQIHVPVHASGPHAYLEAPLYHLDLVVNDRAVREAKVSRYEHVRPGLRLGGLALNAAYYLPELRDELVVAAIPELDAALIEHVRGAEPGPPGASGELRIATRAEIDAHWAERPLRNEDYRAGIELGDAPSPVAGEVREIDVRVTNLGGVLWPGGQDAVPEIRLSSRWEGLELPDEQLRSPFPCDVAPGETVLVPLSFRAPGEPGDYRLVVDVVHERHRWFEIDAKVDVTVRPKRRAVVLVGQPPGEEGFDSRVDDLLVRIDPALKPVLVGPKPEWLRDRFGAEALSARPPAGESVFVIAAGPRRRRLRLELLARELRFESWRGAHGPSGRLARRHVVMSSFLALAIAVGAIAGGLVNLGATVSRGSSVVPKAQQRILHEIDSTSGSRSLAAREKP